MTVDKKLISKRWVRSLIATLVALAATWAAGPHALELVGKDNQVYLLAVVVPTLHALDKYLREKWKVKVYAAAAAAKASSKKKK
jgi:hypothetical protein